MKITLPASSLRAAGFTATSSIQVPRPTISTFSSGTSSATLTMASKKISKRRWRCMRATIPTTKSSFRSPYSFASPGVPPRGSNRSRSTAASTKNTFSAGIPALPGRSRATLRETQSTASQAGPMRKRKSESTFGISPSCRERTMRGRDFSPLAAPHPMRWSLGRWQWRMSGFSSSIWRRMARRSMESKIGLRCFPSRKSPVVPMSRAARAPSISFSRPSTARPQEKNTFSPRSRSDAARFTAGSAGPVHFQFA